jgi:DNA invertase Pin-like site-specific DNA recombinase
VKVQRWDGERLPSAELRDGNNFFIGRSIVEKMEAAVRAAFNAGVTPSRIARQFRISKSDVRKALASDEKK